jgi:Fur family ferric uptake transcriptional regulator
MANENELLEFLSKKKLNVTQQRLEIANLFLELEGHHTLEEIYLEVRKRTGTVGQSTVYRTIRLLCDAGLAREVILEDGSSRYESALGREHHDHLMCRKCGKIVEFIDPDIEKLQKKIAEEHGFLLQGHGMMLLGLCNECRTADDSAKE